MRVVTPGQARETGAALRDAARHWIVAVAENPERETECLAWRAADPAHEEAWQEADRVWRQAANLGALDRPDWRAEIDALTVPAWRRPLRWAIAASVVLAFGGTFYLRSLPDLQAETAVAETRQLALTDGSQVTLSGRSGVAVHFAAGSRRVVGLWQHHAERVRHLPGHDGIHRGEPAACGRQRSSPGVCADHGIASAKLRFP